MINQEDNGYLRLWTLFPVWLSFFDNGNNGFLYVYLKPSRAVCAASWFYGHSGVESPLGSHGFAEIQVLQLSHLAKSHHVWLPEAKKIRGFIMI